MASNSLIEIDRLEALVIIDNELDIMSPVHNTGVQAAGLMGNIALDSDSTDGHDDDRGGSRELRMERICCAAHGLSVLVTATKDDVRRTMLFDVGPEEEAWERNVKRLQPDLAEVERIQLSHWHRDHSGGMLKAIRMIKHAKAAKGEGDQELIVDLHPSRPDNRGFTIGTESVSLEADPTFQDIEEAGGIVEKHSSTHTVLENMLLVSGEIPRQTEYENGLKNGIRFDRASGKWEEDEMIADERFLACNVKGKGIVVLTGCSHAGVVNATRHAVELIGKEVPLHAVIGGYHLSTSQPEHVSATVCDLKALDPAILLPGHCSGWRVKFEIEKELPGRLVPSSVGVKYTF
ncbi:hypothetical protein AJ80_03329 [Polytolypa hystricis UAMH7299]|uniref:Metallo-beta-lactamase domain-containing protein n=1 Tax=Polytolypa hystricis (strain UAMH7299) TaxID=1447883 RepID=A0A2B7YKP4_POLH7|nr:hypothetical protein AJ80_03329 [Polytolypa hystricis UAMH7299]